MRKTLKRNLSYDDRNHLYYVSLYYDGENGRRVRRTRTYPTMEQAEQVMPVTSNFTFMISSHLQHRSWNSICSTEKKRGFSREISKFQESLTFSLGHGTIITEIFLL